MTYTLHLPMLHLPNDPIEPQAEPEKILLSPWEDDLLWEIAHHPDQRRASLLPHATLMQVARTRATDMAQRGYVGHVDAEGHGPNYHVLRAGYVLPDHYQRTDEANNIESLAAGQRDARSVIEGWSQSAGHWTHVMGQKAFYREQVRCGIGYVRDLGAERYGYWWCLITCPEQK